ncbi:hypothetical protein V8E54_008508 [Elaphomyces granulatus]
MEPPTSLHPRGYPPNRETFSQLRQEFLQGDCYSQIRDDKNLADINRLISVVIKAGLELGNIENSSLTVELEGQILDCLDIIQAAIERAPQTLLEYCDPELLGVDIQAPLYVWLVIRLVDLSGVWNHNNFNDKIQCLLSYIVFLQHKTLRTHVSRYSISAFLQACATDILVSLEGITFSDPQQFVTFTAVIPSANGSLLADLDKLRLPRELFHHKLKLGSFLQGTACLLQVLDSIIPQLTDGSLVIGTATSKHILAWKLHICQRLWTVLFRWIHSSCPSRVQHKSQIAAHFLTCIRKCSEHSSSIGRMAPLNVKARCILFQSMADLLSVEALRLHPDVQVALHRCLETVADTDHQMLTVVLCMEDVLFPILFDIKRNEHEFKKFTSSFQASSPSPSLHDLSDQTGADQSGRATHGLNNSNELLLTTANSLHKADVELGDRARKRIRLSQSQINPSNSDFLQRLINRTYAILGRESSADITELSIVVLDLFPQLTLEVQCELLSTIGKFSCAGAGSLVEISSNGTLETETLQCHTCDTGYVALDQASPWQIPGFERILLDVLSILTRSTTPRMPSLLCLRRILIHDPESDRLQITSIFGELCLHSLRSSLRELRLASGLRHVLTAFVRRSLDSELRRRNFVIILECLKNLSEKKEDPIQETSDGVRISGDEELNIILLRLLEYLGCTNPYICAVTYIELLKLSQHMSTNPASLFRPFWRTLSVAVMKNIQTRPHMAEQLCDLLGMKVDDFLRLTEAHILPYLVLMRKRDIILRIGASYQTTKSPFDLCSEKGNLASILAFLLSQPFSEPEAMILSLFAAIDPQFKKHSLSDFVRTEPISIACDLLKALGDASEGQELRFHRALDLLASFVPRKSGHGPTSFRRQDILGNFIEEHILGIITEFANTINDFQVRQPIIEKRRGIIAIGEMIKIAHGHIGSALPQICACLRSALDINELCDHAFAAWSVLISSLDEIELEPLIDQTLAIIIRYWEKFHEETRTRAFELVEYILRAHGNIVQNVFDSIPSLSSIPIMAKFDEQICVLKEHMDSRAHFMTFIRRCQNENPAVVEQALRELVPYLTTNEDFIHTCVLNEQPDGVVALLTRSLLDCCVKFKNNSDLITVLSAKCLGLIGCLDPNRVETVRETKDILVLSNFERMEETFDFVLFFLHHVLVDAFLSASNTRAQGFLAYAMQSLLKLCKLNTTDASKPRDIEVSEMYQRWLALPETVRNTLTPFRTSKYTVTIGAINAAYSYPLFSPTLSHGEWLRNFVQDMLQKGDGDNVKLIFTVCGRIIRGQDISISSFLLPFAALNLTLEGKKVQKEYLKQELITVLSHPLPHDYLSRWLQGKKKQHASLGSYGQSNRSHTDATLKLYSSQIKNVEQLLSSIPPEIISRRAVECKSFSRALFHWEQYIRQCKARVTTENYRDLEPLYQRLQDIYTQIDEPDGIEGISTYLHVLNIDQQVLEHRKEGRWVAAQSWYELQLDTKKENSEAQSDLLMCLKESGQQEASWVTGKWDKLAHYIEICSKQNTEDFNVGVGSALHVLRQGKISTFKEIINDLRQNIAKSFTANSVASLQSCHSSILQLHALAEIDSIAEASIEGSGSHSSVLETLDRRLDVLGGYLSEKQYVLGLRRAAMELSTGFSNSDIASIWLTTARLLRKGNFTNQAYQAVLNAARLKDKSATIEHARLLWKDSQHRKAIQTLKGAIAANSFVSYDCAPIQAASAPVTSNREPHQNMLTARAHLLLAKWTDRAGQTQSDVIVQRYREAIKLHTRWEKAHYYLGKHYNKILESEKTKPMGKEAQIYLSGEASKLVIDNYLRSLAHGNKYVFQTLPKILTLWLEHASVVDQPFDPKRGDNDRDTEVEQEAAKKLKTEQSVVDMRAVINQGQKFSEELLRLCVARIEDKLSKISLAQHLGFNHKVTPCRLVIPFQTLLTPSLPANHDSDYLKSFRAFPRETITIDIVDDDAQVLNSLQKPRKIGIRGSDGRTYNLLCKPKDDLRKDQRLMEFNNMINRFLKKDVESSKRRMYIKTYAVTPLNEECGLIEWVDNLQTLREIVIKLLRERGVSPNVCISELPFSLDETSLILPKYNDIKKSLDEACSDISKLPLFTTDVLAKFPPVLHEWFVEMFPEAGAWFAARLRYTRSCAVMSMVGYVLGLGDRHGENILFEEGTGGILHVDFNCLFDKVGLYLKAHPKSLLIV